MIGASKIRVAPMKEQTIPTLELLGATILLHLINGIHKDPTLRVDKYCWTNLLTTLCWINSKQWKQYTYEKLC